MRFPDQISISPSKINDLRLRVERLGIDLARIEEQFVRGGGPGGQKRNKTSSTVVLRDPDRNLVIRCSRDRRRSINRFLALRELVERIEATETPGLSRKLGRIEKLRRQKANRRRKAKRKYGRSASD